jgi:hypothetical protein
MASKYEFLSGPEIPNLDGRIGASTSEEIAIVI